MPEKGVSWLTLSAVLAGNGAVSTKKTAFRNKEMSQ
jgi:hypothetical protein